MKRIAFVSACLAVGLSLPGSARSKEPAPAPRPAVQIALLLDTSNSMDGLIAQAKTQLWSVVHEFVRAKKVTGFASGSPAGRSDRPAGTRRARCGSRRRRPVSST